MSVSILERPQKKQESMCMHACMYLILARSIICTFLLKRILRESRRLRLQSYSALHAALWFWFHASESFKCASVDMAVNVCSHPCGHVTPSRVSLGFRLCSLLLKSAKCFTALMDISVLQHDWITRTAPGIFFFVICCMSVNLLDDWFAHLQRFTLTASAVKEFYLTKAQQCEESCYLQFEKLQATRGKKHCTKCTFRDKKACQHLVYF